jgi:uncharacterized protein YciW
MGAWPLFCVGGGGNRPHGENLLGAPRVSVCQVLDLEQEASAAAEELETTRRELKKAQDTADRRLQELRSRVGTNQAQQSEMLRQAQDICLEAEERAETAERCARVRACVSRSHAKYCIRQADFHSSLSESRMSPPDAGRCTWSYCTRTTG